MESTRNRTLRIVAPVDDPFANECFTSYPMNEACNKPGIELEYLYLALNKFMLYPIEWIQVEDYEEMNAYISEGKADIQGISQFFDEEFILKGFGHSPIFLHDAYVLIVREQIAVGSDQFELFKVFNYGLWVALIGSVLAFFCIQWAAKKFTRVDSVTMRALQWCRDRMFQALWLVVLTIFASFFTNVMSIDLVIRKKTSTLPFYTFEEFHQKLYEKKCQWVLLAMYEDDDELWPSIINPDEDNHQPWAAGFRNAYAVNKPTYVNSRDEVAAKVQDPNACFVGLDYVTVSTYYLSRYCNIKMLPEMPLNNKDLTASTPTIASMPKFDYMYWTNPNASFILHDLEQVFASDSMSHLYEWLEQKYYRIPFPPACKSEFNAPTFTPMPIVKILGSVWLFLAALLIALLCFLGELVYRRWKLRHSKDFHITPVNAIYAWTEKYD